MDESHRALGVRLGRLRGVLDGSLPWDSLPADLRSLRTELEQHFVFEETELYMQDVMGLDPVQWAEIQEIVAQHAGFLEELEKVQLALQDPAPQPAAGVGRCLELFLRQLAHHEHAETVLVQRAFGA